jgi:hypothetical protein
MPDSPIAQYVVPAIVGLLSGCLGSLVAPWVTWGIEKRRERQGARRALVKVARQAACHEEFGHIAFVQSAPYSQLRPHLSKNFVEMVEDSTLRIVVGSSRHGGPLYRTDLLDELARLEKEWRLI